MSRTLKDRPYRLDGQRHKFWISENGHNEFKKQCNRQIRRAAHLILHDGFEPEPRSPKHYVYWD